MSSARPLWITVAERADAAPMVTVERVRKERRLDPLVPEFDVGLRIGGIDS